MKKVMMLASVASMIDQFNIPNIELLQSLNYQVDVVADFTHPGTITVARANLVKQRLEEKGVRVFDVAIPRSVRIGAIRKAYRKVKTLMDNENYDLVHCHSPIGSVVARLAARKKRKTGTKVIYTAHGFHFYKGVSIKNWMLFYPIEKWLSRYTDVLITINKEDYRRAEKKFKAKKTVYVPGIGIDTASFGKNPRGNEIRSKLGLSDEATILLSVGELNDNKNHEVVIRALPRLERQAYYVIVGRGPKEEYLKKLAEELGVGEFVRLVGFQSEVRAFYSAADIFVFPSFREGLSAALMEAMASGLPVACSQIRGNVDLIDEQGGSFFSPTDVDSIVQALNTVMNSNLEAMSRHNLDAIKAFDRGVVEKDMLAIYSSCTSE